MVTKEVNGDDRDGLGLGHGRQPGGFHSWQRLARMLDHNGLDCHDGQPGGSHSWPAGVELLRRSFHLRKSRRTPPWESVGVGHLKLLRHSITIIFISIFSKWVLGQLVINTLYPPSSSKVCSTHNAYLVRSVNWLMPLFHDWPARFWASIWLRCEIFETFVNLWHDQSDSY